MNQENQVLEIELTKTLKALKEMLDEKTKKGADMSSIGFKGEEWNFINMALFIIKVAYLLVTDKLLMKPLIYSNCPYYPPDPTKKTLSGLLIVPKDSPKEIPILCYQHGTQILRECVPSKFPALIDKIGEILRQIMEMDFLKIPELLKKLLEIPEFYDVFLAAYLTGVGSRKNAVLLPDYPAMGADAETNYVQPYEIAEPMAQYVLAFLQNAIEKKELKNSGIGTDWNNKLFLLGYSQGGYVTMAVARKYMAEYQRYKKYPLIGCAPMGGPYSVSKITRGALLETTKPSTLPFFAPMTIRSYHDWYHGKEDFQTLCDKGQAFKCECNQNLAIKIWEAADGRHKASEVDDLINTCCEKKLGKMISKGLKEALNGSALPYLQEQDTFREWTDQQYDNPKPMKMNIYHGLKDEIVIYQHAKDACDELNNQIKNKNLKLDLQLKPIETKDPILNFLIKPTHVREAFQCCVEALKWIESL